MTMNWGVIGAGVLLLAATPVAAADVKLGVDAWNRGDYRTAVDNWRRPATEGDADAQFNLGQAYKLGRGVAVDPVLASEWFRRAALQGHAQAQDNYALILFQDGHKADALPWLEKGAKRDEKRTELVLGTMLFNGDGVPKDWTRAYALVTRAQQQGLPQAGPTLAQMDQYIPEAQRQQGVVMARRIEADARTATFAAPIPARVAEERAPLPAPAAAAAATPAPASTKVAKAAPAPAKPARPAPPPATKPATGGAWRIQLGAFRDAGNARALWSKVGEKVGGKPDYVTGGGMTRLQATGFASRDTAQAACRKSGTSCVVVAP